MSNKLTATNAKIGTRVRHSFSSHHIGTITSIRDDELGYDYLVEWDDAPVKSDWYKKDALVLA